MRVIRDRNRQMMVAGDYETSRAREERLLLSHEDDYTLYNALCELTTTIPGKRDKHQYVRSIKTGTLSARGGRFNG